MEATTTSDVFDVVIKDLFGLAEKAKPLNTQLEEASTTLAKLDSVMLDVSNCGTVLDEITKLTKKLAFVLTSLQVVPVLDGIAAALSTVLNQIKILLNTADRLFNEVKNAVITPVHKVLQELNAPLKKARLLLSNCTEKVPEFLSTIRLLNLMCKVAEPLVLMLSGDSSERLSKILAGLKQTKEAVNSALKPVMEIIRAIQPFVDWIKSAFANVIQEIKNVVDGVLKGLKSVGQIFTPITNTFDEILNALQPVKWALEAVACLFEKIVQPVLDWIMNQTGITALLKRAGDSVMQALQFDRIKELIQSKIHPGDLQNQLAIFGSRDFPQITTNLFSSLADYRTLNIDPETGKPIQGQAAVSRMVMQQLLAAVVGASANVAPVIPEWIDPDLSFLDYQTVEDINHMGVKRGRLLATAPPPPPIRLTYDRSVLNNKLRALFPQKRNTPASASFMVLLKVEEIPRPPLPQFEEIVWPEGAKAIREIDSLLNVMIQLTPRLQNFALSVDHFDHSLELSELFQEQIDDLHTMFGTCDHLMGLLLLFNVPFVSIVLNIVRDVIVQQRSAAENVKTKTGTFANEVKRVHAAAQPIIELMENGNTRNVLMDGSVTACLEGWKHGILQLIAMVEEGRKETLNLTNSGPFTSRLALFQTSLETSFKELSTRLNLIQGDVEVIEAAVEMLQADLDKFSLNLCDVSDHSSLIPVKALPTLTQIVRLLSQLDAIIDPLAELLKLGKCVEADDTVKGNAREIVDKVLEGSKSVAEDNILKAITPLIENLMEKELPLSKLAEAVDACAKTLAISVFTEKATELPLRVGAILTSLRGIKSYQMTLDSSGEPVIIENDFIDSAFVSEVSKFVKQILVADRNPASIT